jgi:predicted SprT family Zn-dependent metalloprotease
LRYRIRRFLSARWNLERGKLAALGLTATLGLTGLVAGANTGSSSDDWAPAETSISTIASVAAHGAPERILTDVQADPMGATTLPTKSTKAYRSAMRSFLNTLPSGKKVQIEWGNPEGHLGGVWMPGSTTIILNASRLDKQEARTKDVLRHEVAHVYQNWAMAKSGLSLGQYQKRMDKYFGANSIERSADAVAYVLGAKNFAYQHNFSKAQLAVAKQIIKCDVPK